jgi:hypothetical protein
MPYKLYNLGWCWSVTQGALLLRLKQFLVPVFPCIEVGQIKYTTWYSLRMCYVQSKLEWNHSVLKGFSSYLPLHCSVVNEICDMLLTVHVQQAIKVR